MIEIDHHPAPQDSARKLHMLIQSRILIEQANITKLQVDEIVNAANTSLLGGGGVDGAIHRAAGPELLGECRELGGCPTGEAKITKGYRLPAKWVVHAVGPIWQGGTKNEPELLANCYKSCFRLAERYRLRSLAFPAIGCGVYRYPIDAAVEIASRETVAALKANESIEKVISACFGESVYTAYVTRLKQRTD